MQQVATVHSASSMSLATIEKLEALIPNHSCLYKALDSILPHCLVPVDIHERTWLGVCLSICEYEAASVQYPELCKHRDRLLDCTRLLESKATWWTTFSGNYRHISTVCSEVRQDHEVDHAARLFRNITLIYEEYQSVLDVGLHHLRNVYTEMGDMTRDIAELGTMHNARLDEMSELGLAVSGVAAQVAQIKAELAALQTDSEHNVDAQHHLRDLVEELFAAFSGIETQVTGTSNALAVQQDSLASQGKLFEVLHQDLTVFREKAATMDTFYEDLEDKMSGCVHLSERLVGAHAGSVEELQNAVERSARTLDATAIQLKQASASLLGWLGVLSTFLSFLSQYFIALGILLVVVMAIFKRRRQQPTVKDIVFL